MTVLSSAERFSGRLDVLTSAGFDAVVVSRGPNSDGRAIAFRIIVFSIDLRDAFL